MRSHFLILILLIFCISCTNGREKDETIRNSVVILFDPGGLGDNGYNDNILRGILHTAKKRGVELSFYCPNDIESGWKKYEEWIAALPGKNGKSLFIFGSYSYEEILQNSCPQHLENGTVILIEGNREIDNVISFSVDLFWASYCIGRLVGPIVNNASTVLANYKNPHILRCLDGFVYGFQDSGNFSEVETYILRSEDSEGFNIPDIVYDLAYSLFNISQFVFPIAGGSNMGIYKYTREFPEKGYTAGIDADMSAYSSQVLVSLIKRIDLIIDRYIAAWLADEKIPQYKEYGFDSDYVDVALSPRYSLKYSKLLNEYKKIAKEKEEAHEI